VLKIYNSLTSRAEEFTPRVPGKIGIYVCGNTVYDYCHIGHARSMIMFDVVVRYLRSRGYDVTYVRNITDIDDKIIKRALDNHEPIDSLTRRFIDAQHEDETALGILPPDHEPRATEYIPQMLNLITQLFAAGYAYVAKSGAAQGDVLFNVRKFHEYGKLSGNTVDKLLSSHETGKKILSVAEKADAVDFALWKISKPGEPHWPSPWGEGRPGWHIECSAMSTGLLGQPFDIHGGGMDLKFPHHENEIAQSEAAGGEQFAKCWMHVGLLLVNGEKMSKSLGNFLTIRDALAKYFPEEIRFFMLNSHYTRPADFAEASLAEARLRLQNLYLCLHDLPEPAADAVDTTDFHAKFNAVMDEDFSTTVALGILTELGAKINTLRMEGKTSAAAVLGKTLRHLAKILGILQRPQEYFKGSRSATEWAQISALEKQRDAFRVQKKWQEADQIRQQLTNMGLEVEDTPAGTRTRIKRI
jgi:cysteinyl-tRNA synthetase